MTKAALQECIVPEDKHLNDNNFSKNVGILTKANGQYCFFLL